MVPEPRQDAVKIQKRRAWLTRCGTESRHPEILRDRVQRNVNDLPTALDCTSAPCVIDQQMAHGTCGDSEKMSVVVPTLLLTGKREVRLVDKCGRCQGMMSALTTKLRHGTLAQVAVQHPIKGIPSLSVATLRTLEQ
ncbi:MAG: hypothetical protein Rubg2KO_21560 [Rubricoccaceae bacterium]